MRMLARDQPWTRTCQTSALPLSSVLTCTWWFYSGTVSTSHLSFHLSYLGRMEGVSGWEQISLPLELSCGSPRPPIYYRPVVRRKCL